MGYLKQKHIFVKILLYLLNQRTFLLNIKSIPRYGNRSASCCSTWVGHNQLPPLRTEGAQSGAGGIPGAQQCLRLHAPAHRAVAVVQQAVGKLWGQLGGQLPSQVVLRGHQTRGVVHLNLQVGQWIQQGGVGHGDFVGHVMESVNRAAVHGGRWGQVRGCC